MTFNESIIGIIISKFIGMYYLNMIDFMSLASIRFNTLRIDLRTNKYLATVRSNLVLIPL